MSTPSVNPADEAVLVRLGRAAIAIDPPPPLSYQFGYAALSVRRLDSELAELVADSTLEIAGVRGGGEARLLSFEAGELSVEVQLTPSGDRVAVLGQVVPPPADSGGVVRLESRDRTAVTAELAQVGGFRFDSVPEGLVRFHVELPGASSVTTTWVSV